MSATTNEMLNRVRISEVYQALGGPKLRRTRGPAFWRGGDGFNVSMDDSRGVWHDFTTDEGGGVLDLVARVRGGNRADALRWCADLAGIPLSDEPLSAEDRERWARERGALERDLPAARYWLRAALAFADEVLERLKVAFFDARAEAPPDVSEMQNWTARLARWRKLDGAALVAEYRRLSERHPGMTAAMVRAAKHREQVQRRALLAYLAAVDGQEAAA